MPKFALIVLLFILFLVACTLYSTYYQALLAYRFRISPTTPVTPDTAYQTKVAAYANAVAEQVPPEKPIIFLVPLNGFPNSIDHPSVRNARVALDVLAQIPGHKKYVILSEGYTGATCMSGAKATALMLSVEEGYNAGGDITILLEGNARTTLENILNSRSILRTTFPTDEAYLVVAGMSDLYPLGTIDTGHGARAYMFAKQNYASLPNIHTLGLLPTNEVDHTIVGYAHGYNVLTMYLGANGLLNLPLFSKKHNSPVKEDCLIP